MFNLKELNSSLSSSLIKSPCKFKFDLVYDKLNSSLSKILNEFNSNSTKYYNRVKLNQNEIILIYTNQNVWYYFNQFKLNFIMLVNLTS